MCSPTARFVCLLVSTLAAAVGPIAQAARAPTPLPHLPGYFAHDHSIGPKSQQYNASHVLQCESSSTCPMEAASACSTSRAGKGSFPFICRSFAILRMGTGKTAQLYSTDYNESYYVPHWSMWSLSDGPAHHPGPSPAPPPHSDESGREDYCAAKRLAFNYAAKLLAKADAADLTMKLQTVSDALQLETACKTPFVAPPAADAADMVSVLNEAQADEVTALGPHHVIYVDPFVGVDNHMAGAVDRPMRTVEAAMARLRSLRSKATPDRASESNFPDGPKPAELVLRGGVHYASQTIELTAADSHLTIRGYRDENAVLSAGSPLTLTWQPVPGRPGVFSSSVPANISEFASLYVAGRRAVRSRSPDANPETMGLHTPNQTGYFSPSATKPNGTLKQQCGPAFPPGLCPVVPGPPWQPGSVFTYGHFTGSNDKSVGYAPSFEPYWCGKWSGLSAITYDLEAPVASADPLLPDGPSDAVLHMTRGTSDIWANFQWNITAHDLSKKQISLGKGGWQFPRGTTHGHWFVDNAGLSGLTSAGEWYHDRKQNVLYMVGNDTKVPPTDVIVSQRPVVLRQRGTAAEPVRGVALHDLTVAHAEVTYTLPYETPSGGGYSVHRGGSVEIEGAEDPVVKNVIFDSPGGNGLLLSGYVRGASIEQNEFKWVGDSAIVLLGRTDPAQPCNGTNGEQPRGSQIFGNFIHEVGVWGKQGCGVFQALTMGTNISHTVVFNGPRAGVLWNDGMGGSNNLEHSLLFNLVRETTACVVDQNSWDRSPYVVDGIVGPRLNTIHHNLILCTYQCTWPIDHDDGSNHYLDTENVLWYGGAKNFLGHNKHSLRNLYLYVDAKPYEGQGPGKHMDTCANNDGASSGNAASGYGEIWASNRCHLTNPGASVYAYDKCSPEDLNATVDYTFNNSFFTTDGKITVRCSGERWTLEQYQALGYDKESMEETAPALTTLLSWAREMLQLHQP